MGLLDLAWEPTGLLGLYVGNYRSYGAFWAELGTLCWQPTGLTCLMGPV